MKMTKENFNVLKNLGLAILASGILLSTRYDSKIDIPLIVVGILMVVISVFVVKARRR